MAKAKNKRLKVLLGLLGIILFVGVPLVYVKYQGVITKSFSVGKEVAAYSAAGIPTSQAQLDKLSQLGGSNPQEKVRDFAKKMNGDPGFRVNVMTAVFEPESAYNFVVQNGDVRTTVDALVKTKTLDIKLGEGETSGGRVDLYDGIAKLTQMLASAGRESHKKGEKETALKHFSDANALIGHLGRQGSALAASYYSNSVETQLRILMEMLDESKGSAETIALVEEVVKNIPPNVSAKAILGDQIVFCTKEAAILAANVNYRKLNPLTKSNVPVEEMTENEQIENSLPEGPRAEVAYQAVVLDYLKTLVEAANAPDATYASVGKAVQDMKINIARTRGYFDDGSLFVEPTPQAPPTGGRGSGSPRGAGAGAGGGRGAGGGQGGGGGRGAGGGGGGQEFGGGGGAGGGAAAAVDPGPLQIEKMMKLDPWAKIPLMVIQLDSVPFFNAAGAKDSIELAKLSIAAWKAHAAGGFAPELSIAKEVKSEFGGMMAYSKTDTGFRVIGPGRDGKTGTPDDMAFSSPMPVFNPNSLRPALSAGGG